MNHRQDIDLAGFDVINDPVWAFYYLTDLLQSVLRDDSTGLRESFDLLRSTRQTVHHVLSIFRGILCNISVNSS